jgi:ankyrin repeat protein
MHFATALGNKVTEDDIHEVHSADPLSMQRYNLLKPKSNTVRTRITKYTPCHFLCMQRYPSISLVRYLSMRDLKAFSICVIGETSAPHLAFFVKNALQLAAVSSESIELLRILLQIDQSMIKKPESHISSKSALGYLCERSASQFSTFNGMLECLMTADNSSEVLNEGILSSFHSYGKSDSTDIKALLALIESLLEADNDTSYGNTIFRSACSLLDGELCIAVLSLLITKYNEGAELRVRDVKGHLPVHTAAMRSKLDVVKYLLQADPESANDLITSTHLNLLHCALASLGDTATKIAKIQYLCDQYPELLHMRSRQGFTPLHSQIMSGRIFNSFYAIKIMCQADETILRDKCTGTTGDELDGMLPLHLLLRYFMVEETGVSIISDIFRFVLHHYPAAVGVKDGEERNVYDLATEYRVDDYFIRLLLDADRSVEPERRLDLNYKARKEALFLSYRALSTDREPIIWVKLRNESRDLLRHTISYL